MAADMTLFLAQLAKVISAGKREVCMDDATDYGRISVDNSHGANGKQSALGHLLPTLAIKGYLTSTDRRTRSKSPQRKGGMQAVWLVTDKGIAWAAELSPPQLPPRKRTIKRQELGNS